MTREHVYQRYVLEGYPAISAPTRRSHGPGGARCRGAPGPPTPARKTDAHKRTGAGARIHAGAATSPDLPPVDRSDPEDPHGCGDESTIWPLAPPPSRGPAQAQRRDSGSDNARPIYVITTPRCHNQNPVDFRASADPAGSSLLVRCSSGQVVMAARPGAGRVRLA